MTRVCGRVKELVVLQSIVVSSFVIRTAVVAWHTDDASLVLNDRCVCVP